MIIIFMSYGAVNLPKKYFKMRKVNLDYEYFRVSQKEEQQEEYLNRVEELSGAAIYLDRICEGDFKIYCAIIIARIPENILIKGKNLARKEFVDDKYHYATFDTLVKLNTKVKDAIGNYDRATTQLDDAINRSVWIENLLRSEG